MSSPPPGFAGGGQGGGICETDCQRDPMRHPLRDLARKLRTNLTDTERFVWSKIRKKQFAGFRFRRQRPIGPYLIDLVCLEARLVLECDGGQHAVCPS